MKNHEEVYKEALELFSEELKRSDDLLNRQQLRWEEARDIFCKTSHTRVWKLWGLIRHRFAAHTMRAADMETTAIRVRKQAVLRAVLTINSGFAPDENVLNVLQHIANEALTTQMRLVGIQVPEIDWVNAHAEKAHHAVEAMREIYRKLHKKHAA